MRSTKKATPEDTREIESIIEYIASEKIKSKKIGRKLPIYPEKLRKRCVNMHFKLGTKATLFATELGLGSATIIKWIAKHKKTKHVTGQIHGTSVRYDIPSKCQIVKQHIEKGVEIHKLATKYNVSQASIAGWKTKYIETYEVYIHLPAGTMIIGKEEKRVSGLDNILIVMEQLESDREALKKMIRIMHNKGLNTSKEDQTMHDVENDIEIMKAGQAAMKRNKDK